MTETTRCDEILTDEVRVAVTSALSRKRRHNEAWVDITFRSVPGGFVVTGRCPHAPCSAQPPHSVVVTDTTVPMNMASLAARALVRSCVVVTPAAAGQLIVERVPALLSRLGPCPMHMGEIFNSDGVLYSSCDLDEIETIEFWVLHLNDSHRASREFIADWLESLGLDLTIRQP